MQFNIDGIPFEMKSPFDLTFLKQWGHVFKVFDDQDSGNICFGASYGKNRYFIKLAGAQTKRGGVDPEAAIKNLKATVPIYRALNHENLIELVDTADVNGGFFMVFKWADGLCMGRMYPESSAQFMALPVSEKLHAFAAIQDFFIHVARQKYVAIDFYDGSIMYDPAARKTTICDIDFFRKQPLINTMGRMWGSSRFMSPEEFELDAPIDEITNVYTLGATAFALFGNYCRNRDSWLLNDNAFHVAQKAICPDRTGRFQTINAFSAAWRGALNSQS